MANTSRLATTRIFGVDDKDIKKFIKDNEDAYSKKIIVPTVSVGNPYLGNDGNNYKNINIGPAGYIESTTLNGVYSYSEIKDETGVGTGIYNLPVVFTVSTREIEATDKTEKIPRMNYTYLLQGGSYKSQDTANISINVSDGIEKDYERIDYTIDETTTTTLYPSPESTTYTHIYATESTKPGKGHGDEDTVYEKFLVAYDNNTNARDQINSIDYWLYEMMEKNENTIEFVDTVKYLLYMYDGKNRGVTELELDNMFEETKIDSFDNPIYGDTIQEKVWFALKGLGLSDVSAAAAMGNIHWESGGFQADLVEHGYNENNGGIGICQWTNNNRGTKGRNTNLKKYAKSKGKTWKDEDTQVEFLVGELTKGGGADGYAKFALMNTSYTGTNYNYKEWLDAKDTEKLDKNQLNKLTEVFCFTFERPSVKYAHVSDRQDWALKYYNQFHGKERSGGSFTKSNKKGVVGTFTSGITGKTFTILDQTKISGWGYFCNKAVAVCIASGYTNDEIKSLRSRAEQKEQIMSNMGTTNWFFNKYGLTAKKGSYSIKNIREILNKGEYIGIRFSSAAYGKSGQDYASKNGHWIGIIGYKKESGKEQIFISDSAHGGTGWHDIDEFESSSCKRTLQYFTVVSVK